MEDVLEVYARPEYDKRPLVCMDECPRQLIGETRVSLPAEPGKPERYDTEYVRKGVAEQFVFIAPLKGWRRVAVEEHRTREDWAKQIKKLVDEDFPEAEIIVLVMDNLNTHAIASLYTAFSPEEALRIKNKLEIHYTPKHGSWLNMAEIEINVLNNHGLSKRIPALEQMREEAEAWATERNTTCRKINWRFTTADARIKLKRLYPKFEP
jgi:transposase